MTPQDKAALNYTIFDIAFPPFHSTTLDNTPTLATELELLADGIIAIIANATAMSADGSQWAAWLVQEAIYTVHSSVLHLWRPIAPVNPTSDSGGTAHNMTLTFGISGTKAQIKVTGLPATSIRWNLHAAGNYTGHF